MSNYIIDHVGAWNNYGDRNDGGVTGNGIMLEGVYNARISYSVAHDNGKDGKSPVGIWRSRTQHHHRALRVLQQQHCHKHRRRRIRLRLGRSRIPSSSTATRTTIPAPATSSPPARTPTAATPSATTSVKTMAAKNGRAGIQLWGSIVNASIYNNVVYITPAGNSNTAAFYNHDDSSGGKHSVNVKVFNNVFYTTGGVKILNITSSVATYGDMQFSGNAYYSGGALSRSSGVARPTPASRLADRQEEGNVRLDPHRLPGRSQARQRRPRRYLQQRRQPQRPHCLQASEQLAADQQRRLPSPARSPAPPSISSATVSPKAASTTSESTKSRSAQRIRATPGQAQRYSWRSVAPRRSTTQK